MASPLASIRCRCRACTTAMTPRRGLLARGVNEEAAEYVAKNPKRLGAYATLPVPDMDGACTEARHALDVMKLDGVGLLASYDGIYLGQPMFDRLFEILERALDRGAHSSQQPSDHREC